MTAKATFDKLFEEFSAWVVTQEDESQYAVMLKTTADFKQALYEHIMEIVGDCMVKGSIRTVDGDRLKSQLATYFGQEEV